MRKRPQRYFSFKDSRGTNSKLSSTGRSLCFARCLTSCGRLRAAVDVGGARGCLCDGSRVRVPLSVHNGWEQGEMGAEALGNETHRLCRMRPR